MNRRQNLRLGQFLTTYVGKGTLVALVVAGIGIFIYATAVFINHSEQRDDRRAQMAKQIVLWDKVPDRIRNSVPSSGRKYLESEEYRQSLFLTLSLLQQEGFDGFGFLSEEDLKKAKQGQLKINKVIRVGNWSGFRKNLLLLGTFTFWGLLALCCFFQFAEASDTRGERLIDLPWRKPWTWLFAVVIAPIGTPFMVGSAIIYLVENQPVTPTEEASATEDVPVGEDVSVEETPPIEAPPVQPARPAPSADEVEAARQTWVELRTRQDAENLQERLHDLRRKERDLFSQVSSSGEQVQIGQRQLANVKAAIKALEEHPPSDVPAEAKVAIYNGEFNCLLRLPDVKRVAVTPDEYIDVYLERVLVADEGHKYDIGDYRVRVWCDQEEGRHYQVRCLRSGNLHFDGNPYGEFCFGNRENQIYDYLDKGEYLPAIALMVEGLHHFNENDRGQLADFREVTDEATN